ncbi:MAG: flippase-like domain-containing protein [Candidatus Omnitrophica bacterium]|nr:flippase-like domain-containing protein [Candidatus Omnitrophota bacterium]
MIPFLARFGLSVALLGWILSRIDLTKTWQALKGADPWLMAAAFLIFISTNIIIFFRWKVFVKALDLRCDTFNGARWFLIGLFCNLFLPTSVGGDVVKGMGLAKATGQNPKVFASIVLDRLAGFSGIVVTACVSFAFGRAVVQDSSVLASIALMTAVSMLLAVTLFSRRIFYWVAAAFAFWPRLKKGLMELHDDIVLMRGKQVQGLETVGLSVLAQLVLAFEFYVTAKAMHQQIPLVYFVIFSPLVCVATSLPSIGGLGVREVGWVYLLSKVGVHQGVAVGLSLLNFFFMVLVGIFGGFFYVATLSGRRLQHHQASPGVGRGGA